MGAWDPATSTTTTMNTFLFFSTLIAFSRAATVGVVPGAAIVGNAAPTLSVPQHMTLLPSSTTGWEATLPTLPLRLMLLLRSSPRSPPCPTPWLRPPIPTSPPQLPLTSLPQLSRPIMLPSPSSRTFLPSEPSTSVDQSVPTRLSTSQLFTKPAPTPSRLFPRLWPPQFMVLPMSQLLPFTLPQLLMLLMLLPLLLLDMLVLDMEPVLDMLVLLMEPSPLPQPLLLKQWMPKFSPVPKSDFEWTVPFVCSE